MNFESSFKIHSFKIQNVIKTMNHKNFLLQLTIISVISFLLLFLLNKLPQFAPFQAFSYLSCISFVLFSAMMYFLAARAAVSSDKNLFLQQVLLTTSAKMALCIFVIVGYFKLAEPSSKMYAIPFLIVYLIFTIFETYFMMKLSKVKS
jgi:hypothetical protein